MIFLIHKYCAKYHILIPCILFSAVFLLTGVYHTRTFLAPPVNPDHIYNQIKTPQTASLYGILAKHPLVVSLPAGQQNTRLLMRVESIYHDPYISHEVQIQKASSGLVLLTLKGLLQENLRPGDHFLIKAKIAPVNTFSTPGTFNYKKHLRNQKIFLKGWIDSPQNIIRVNSGRTYTLKNWLSSLLYFPERIRHGIATFIDSTLPQPSRGLYKAILIGDRSDIEPSVLEKFISSGCIHILAISGMHMGLLALITIGILTWLLKRSTWLTLEINVLKVAVCIAIIPLVAYALIAGCNIPVVRALLMTMVFILAVIYDRPGNLINHIILAALIILIWKPSAIFTASFQLSFSAVTSIGIIYPFLHRLFFHNPYYAFPETSKSDTATGHLLFTLQHSISAALLKWFITGIAVTTAAMLGTLPLLLFHFNRISLVAPLTNLLVEPLICFWSLIIGINACLLIPFAPAIAKVLFKAGSLGLMLSEKICDFFSAMEFSALRVPTPSHLEITLYYIFLVSFVMIFYLESSRKRLSFIIALFSFCILLAIPAFSKVSRNGSVSTSVSILDVGHGSAVLVRFPHDKNILIDGGGAGSESFDIGERVIGPFLWKNQINRLDAVVVSHPHADHYNGLPFILTHFHPRELWINGSDGHDQKYSQLLDLARKLNIAIKIPKSNQILLQSGNARLQCVYNGFVSDNLSHVRKAPYFLHGPDTNDLSLVLKLKTNGGSFLFPGDISGRLASFLASEKKSIQSDILLAPHHGSKSSMSLDFIETVDPEYIAVSAGRNNPFNLPDKSFYDLRQKGIKVFSTGMDGTLTFSLNDNKLELSRYQVN